MKILKPLLLLILNITIYAFYPLEHLAADPVPRFSAIQDIQSMIQRREFSCETITRAYINRILQEDMQFNNKQLPLNAITFINPNALAEAKALDRHSKPVGPLHCVPIVLKDNINTQDMPTQLGSYSFQNSWPPIDATIVGKLKQAGAIIIAKATMAEFAMPPADINSLIGVTGNAYNTNLSPGGSSSGVASAVARGFAVIGIGSDNSGSIRGPAGLNGLIGLRPSYGRISTTGTFPLGELNGVFGPIAYQMKDVATVLSLISGQDLQDKRTQQAKPIDAKPHSLKYHRIGIIRSYKIKKGDHLETVHVDYEYDPNATQIFQTLMTRLKSLGFEIVDHINLGDYNTDQTDLLVGGIDHINAYLKAGYSPTKSYADLCNSGHTSRFGPTKQCLDRVKFDSGFHSKLYRDKVALFHQNADLLKKILDKYQVDALFYLVQKPYYATKQAAKKHFAFIASNAWAPAIDILGPLTTFSPQRPTFFQLIAARNQDETLLAIISQYQQKWDIPRPSVPVLTGGYQFHNIADFNAFKQKLAPQLHDYLSEHKLTTDGLSRQKWRDFLLQVRRQRP